MSEDDPGALIYDHLVGCEEDLQQAFAADRDEFLLGL
jgi:hypothetical protein